MMVEVHTHKTEARVAFVEPQGVGQHVGCAYRETWNVLTETRNCSFGGRVSHYLELVGIVGVVAVGTHVVGVGYILRGPVIEIVQAFEVAILH